MNNWINVMDKTPDSETPVLIYGRLENGKNQITIACAYYCQDGGICWEEVRGTCLISGKRITHWMPLPEPPKELLND